MKKVVVTQEELDRWAAQTMEGDLEAGWKLVRALGSFRTPAADQVAEEWLEAIVEAGGAAHAWRAVELRFEDRDGLGARAWAARANAMQCPPGTGIEVAPTLFAPQIVEGQGVVAIAPSVLVQSPDRERATEVLSAATERLLRVNVLGHEYADEEENLAHLQSFTPGDDWPAYTVNYVSEVEDHELGPWLWMDAKDCFSGPMAGGMLRILLETIHEVGLTEAVLRPAPGFE